LYNKFLRKFPEIDSYRVFAFRLFCAALLLFVNLISFRKSSWFDFSYLNVLIGALKTMDLFKLRKFFLLRLKTMGYSTLRTNMRQFFLLSSFLFYNSFDCNSSFLSTKIEKKINSIDGFFGRISSSIVTTLFFEKYLKPMVECFRFRLYQHFDIILDRMGYMLDFFVITNEHVNASFLSRYIAKKLEYHHKLKHVLNPLKREFKHLGRSSKKTTAAILLHNVVKNGWKSKLKVAWKILLTFIIFQYEIFLKKYISASSLNLSFDNLNILI